jgi:hypothetical protein
MGVFIFKSDKNLAKPRHAVSKQDLIKMFVDKVKVEKVRGVVVDFANCVVRGECLNKSGEWKKKEYKFIEVVKVR